MRKHRKHGRPYLQLGPERASEPVVLRQEGRALREVHNSDRSTLNHDALVVAWCTCMLVYADVCWTLHVGCMLQAVYLDVHPSDCSTEAVVTSSLSLHNARCMRWACEY